MEISKLYNNDLPQVYEMAIEAWKDAYPGQSDAFIRKVSEFIVRKNYYENAYRYKIIEDGIIRAILLGCEKMIKMMHWNGLNFRQKISRVQSF
jgi:hypothetical protein